MLSNFRTKCKGILNKLYIRLMDKSAPSGNIKIKMNELQNLLHAGFAEFHIYYEQDTKDVKLFLDSIPYQSCNQYGDDFDIAMLDYKLNAKSIKNEILKREPKFLEYFFHKFTAYKGKKNKLLEAVEEREKALEYLALDHVKHLKSVNEYSPPEDTALIIGRLWNSWTPSFYNVPGGSYAILPARAKRDQDYPGVIVIDPGFRFLQILESKFGIGIKDINKIIVTHFHPDHIGGIFEYMALKYTEIKNVNEHKVQIFLNETAFNAFNRIAPFKSIKITPAQVRRKLCEYIRKNNHMESIYLIPHATEHYEIGDESNSVAIRLFVTNKRYDKLIERWTDYYQKELLILGDTAFTDKMGFKSIIRSADVVVLHLGSFQSKKYSVFGKHLYADGIADLLRHCRNDGRMPNFVGKKIFLISELGLEQSSLEYLSNNLSSEEIKILKSAFKNNIIPEIEEILNIYCGGWSKIFIPNIGSIVTLANTVSFKLLDMLNNDLSPRMAPNTFRQGEKYV